MHTKRLFALCLAILFIFCACTHEEAVVAFSSADHYLNAIASRDFSRAYSHLSETAQAKIGLSDFVNRYTSIMEGLAVTGISYVTASSDLAKEAGVLFYTLTYQTDLAGELTYEYEIHLKDGKVDWTPALIFPQMDWGDTVVAAAIEPKRGEIFDANSQLLAANTAFLCVYAQPSRIESLQQLADALAPLLAMQAEEILALLESAEAKRDDFIVLKVYEDAQDLSAETTEQLTAMDGVGIDYQHYVVARTYPYADICAHTTGYVGMLSAEEYEQVKDEGYRVDSYIGKAGLEKQYEEALTGTTGFEVFIRTQDGQKKESLYRQDAQNGQDLHLTLDIELQQRAYDALEEYLTQGQSGVVVVLDYKTGAIKAQANYPSFDPNAFVEGVSTDYWNELMDESSNYPMFNRALESLLPPGSILKPVTAAAGLDAGTITEYYNTFNGLNIVNDSWFPDYPGWHYPAVNRAQVPAHEMNLKDCLMWSDNIYFSKLALEMGEDALLSYFDRVGIGESVPYDLPVKTSQVANEGTEFNIKYLSDSSYGQGELLLTPLQLACVSSAFANGGDIMAPYLIESIHQEQDKDYIATRTTEPSVWKEAAVSAEACRILAPIMESVIAEGTGWRLGISIEDVRIGGKTGTAKGGDDKELGWFVAYWIDEEEPRLVAVLVEGEYEQTSKKLEIARALLTPDDQLEDTAGENAFSLSPDDTTGDPESPAGTE
ncbi:MAG: penicillin-binding transpeptidase domain-containing protein [Christensenellales bacterium]